MRASGRSTLLVYEGISEVEVRRNGDVFAIGFVQEDELDSRHPFEIREKAQICISKKQAKQLRRLLDAALHIKK